MENIELRCGTVSYDKNFLEDRASCRDAVTRFKKIYDAGDFGAAYEIGRLYMISNLKNYEEAYGWLKIGAENGDSRAQYYLSKFYEFNLLEKYDLAEAYKWLKCAADQHEERAMLRLAVWYRMGIYVEKDEELAWSFILYLADQGFAEAIYIQAQEYESGNGMVDRDMKQALFYYESAAKKLHPGALYRMGVFCWEGRFVKRDPIMAVQYLRDSCRRGYTEAQYYLSRLCCTDMYYHKSQRSVLLLAAAKANHVQAMYELGCLYLFGDETLEENREEAEYWLRKAADHGHSKAGELCSCIPCKQKKR